jgi:hypothetical protein
MYGSFNEEANEVWDFVRCQRPDGSYYGTAGKCRSGTEVAAKLAKVPKEKLKKLVNHPKLTPDQRKQVMEAIKKPAAPTGWPEEKKPEAVKEPPKAKPKAEPKPKAKAEPKPKPEPKPEAKAEPKPKAEKKESVAQLKKNYADLVKKQQDLVKEGKIEEALKLSKDIGAALSKYEGASPKAKAAADKKDKAATKEAKAQAKPSTAKPKAEEKVPTEADLKKQNSKALQAFRKWKDAEDEKKPKAEVDALKKKFQQEQKKTNEMKTAVENAKNKGAGQSILNKASENFAERQAEYDRKTIAANLTSAQKASIFRYTDETSSYSGKFGYRQLNECARTPQNCEDPKEAKKFSKQLDSAVAALPKNDKGDAFFRGIYVSDNDSTGQLYAALEKATPGKRFKDPAFGSYSSDPGTAKDFGGSSGQKSIIFVSRSKSLTPIAALSSIKDENEALLPRGTEQTIRSVTKDGNQLIVEVD